MQASLFDKNRNFIITNIWDNYKIQIHKDLPFWIFDTLRIQEMYEIIKWPILDWV